MKATKFEKNLRRTFDKSVVFCARNSVFVKKSTKIFQNKCGQVVLYKLYNDTENHGVEVEKSNGDRNVFSSLFLFLKGQRGSRQCVL